MNRVSMIFTKSRKMTNLGSKVIAWRIGRPYSHVAIVFYSPWLGLDLVIQASHGMVHVIPFQNMSRDNMVVKKFDLNFTQEQIARGVRWAVQMCGCGYSEAGAIAATFPILRSLGMGMDGDDEFICSEFSARFLEEAIGQSLEHMRGADDYIDPALLEDLIADLEIETKAMT